MTPSDFVISDAGSHMCKYDWHPEKSNKNVMFIIYTLWFYFLLLRLNAFI